MCANHLRSAIPADGGVTFEKRRAKISIAGERAPACLPASNSQETFVALGALLEGSSEVAAPFFFSNVARAMGKKRLESSVYECVRVSKQLLPDIRK